MKPTSHPFVMPVTAALTLLSRPRRAFGLIIRVQDQTIRALPRADFVGMLQSFVDLQGPDGFVDGLLEAVAQRAAEVPILILHHPSKAVELSFTAENLPGEGLFGPREVPDA